jgi:hypothetical protein
VVFRPQFGIVTPGTGPASATGVRIVQGRDAQDWEMWGDWAIVTLDQDLSTMLGANFQTMARVIPVGPPLGVALYGYHADRFWNQPGQGFCTAQLIENDVVRHDCDVIGGASGGPIWRVVGSSAQLLAVQSGHGVENGGCLGTNSNSAASGRGFSFAPDNAGGLATAHTSNGRMDVYATDKDWTLVGFREKTNTDPSAPWSAWDALDSRFSTGGRKMAATNLANNSQQVWVADAGLALKTKWQTCLDGCWTGWVTQSTPVGVVDVAAAGDVNVITHLFMLGTDGSVRVSHKVGDSSSNWSAWQTLGTVSDATALSAVNFGGIFQVFVSSTSSGSLTAWGSGDSFTGLVPFGTSTGGFRAIASGLLQDGRVSVFAIDGAGTFMDRIRAADGSSWTEWTALPQSNPVNTTGFVSLATGRLTDGREQILGVASNGEIYSIWQVGSASFSAAWLRFYK